MPGYDAIIMMQFSAFLKISLARSTKRCFPPILKVLANHENNQWRRSFMFPALFKKKLKEGRRSMLYERIYGTNLRNMFLPYFSQKRKTINEVTAFNAGLHILNIIARCKPITSLGTTLTICISHPTRPYNNWKFLWPDKSYAFW